MLHPPLLQPKPTVKTALHHALILSVRSKPQPPLLPRHLPLWQRKLCRHLHLPLRQKPLWSQALWHQWLNLRLQHLWRQPPWQRQQQHLRLHAQACLP